MQLHLKYASREFTLRDHPAALAAVEPSPGSRAPSSARTGWALSLADDSLALVASVWQHVADHTYALLAGKGIKP